MVAALAFDGGPFEDSRRTSLRRATSSTDVSYNIDTKLDIDMEGIEDRTVNGKNTKNIPRCSSQSQKRKRVSRCSKSHDNAVDAFVIDVSIAGYGVRRRRRRLVRN